MGDNRYKSYCNGSCTECNSLNIIKSAERWCYEDKFGLKLQAKKLTYYSDGKRHTVATGVIEHHTHNEGVSEEGSYAWENNLNEFDPERIDNVSYLFKETCKTLNVDFKKFVTTLNKIYNEMGAFNGKIEG